ncbi:hypothetical protein EVAR_77567_1 [Eumeta japonica]|uniref:Uncharacterized protein n=1 Tax=Eumeta variegata TaxID=151549 RepID=A0A4C1T9J6_EUMVA|nr:hypothetical protein EVAR_77567_1 [Eumeta japonica]
MSASAVERSVNESSGGPYPSPPHTLFFMGSGDLLSANSHATVFPRHGYPLEKIIEKDLATANPEMRAKVVAWDDGYQILKELLPTFNNIISVNM